jgi:hypothetical protein
MPCYTIDTGVRVGLRENLLLRILHLKRSISVHFEKDAIESFRGRITVIQLAECHCSARKNLGTNMWNNVTETSDSDCRHYFAKFQASVDKYRRSVLFWDITQRIVVIPYRYFGTIHLYHLQGWVNPRTWISWLLKMEEISCLETSVRNYHYTLSNIPGERRFHLNITYYEYATFAYLFLGTAF